VLLRQRQLKVETARLARGDADAAVRLHAVRLQPIGGCATSSPARSAGRGCGCRRSPRPSSSTASSSARPSPRAQRSPLSRRHRRFAAWPAAACHRDRDPRGRDRRRAVPGWFGYVNFLRGFASFRMPSMTPIASLYAAIPICGVLIALFAFEQLVNGWKKRFRECCPGHHARRRGGRAMNAAVVLVLMTGLFLFFGYMGVPVAFSLIAGTVIGRGLRRRHLAALVQKMFRRGGFGGAARHPLLPAGRRAHELGQRRAARDQSFVDHGRPPQGRPQPGRRGVQHVLLGDVGFDHRRRRRDEPHARGVDAQGGLRPPFIAAIIASASTIAALVPPSITAVVYGAVGNVSIAGLFMRASCPAS